MDEQRHFFRINDTAWVDYRRIKHAQLSGSASTHFTSGEECELASELQRLDGESAAQLHAIAERDAELASYLRIQSQKIELIARSLIGTQQSDDTLLQEIIVSEAGMQFLSQEQLKPGQWIAVRVVLKSEPLVFHCFAEVQACEPCAGEDGRWIVNSEFGWRDEHDRDLLAGHVLREQAKQRRLLKA
ncbi:MAG: hypothetical protein AAF542_13640 [Pseudomonadota bacterium]